VSAGRVGDDAAGRLAGGDGFNAAFCVRGWITEASGFGSSVDDIPVFAVDEPKSENLRGCFAAGDALKSSQACEIPDAPPDGRVDVKISDKGAFDALSDEKIVCGSLSRDVNYSFSYI